MFTIRQQHKDAFATQSKKAFEQAAILHLREKLSQRVAGLSDAELGDWVRDVTIRAGQFGLITQQQIMCFLDSEVLLGKLFYERRGYEWAGPILRSGHLQADDRAGLLLATSCSFAGNKAGADA
jgi:hypothetical protein